VRQEPDAVIDRATAALVKAANAQAELDRMLAEINAPNSNLGALRDRFIALSGPNSNVLPRPEELNEAFQESLDTGDAQPGSLYSQMKRLSSSFFCLREV